MISSIMSFVLAISFTGSLACFFRRLTFLERVISLSYIIEPFRNLLLQITESLKQFGTIFQKRYGCNNSVAKQLLFLNNIIFIYLSSRIEISRAA